jgi:hypothetical protein
MRVFLIASFLCFSSLLTWADVKESTLPKPVKANTAPIAASPAAEIAPAAETTPQPETASEKAGAWLQWLSQQLGYKPMPTPPPAESEVGQLRQEVTALRQDVKQLEETLDLLVNKVMADLEKENDDLRREVHRVYGLQAEGRPAYSPGVPRPGGDVVDQVLSQAPPASPDDADKTLPLPAAAKPAAPAEPVAFAYTIVQEWGRTPEAATEIGPNATSLKGMACVVPAGAQRESLEQLGRELHTKYGSFDNLNIEVFDDKDAAKRYADKNTIDAKHRVMSISKHKPSGRDVILLIQNGATIEVQP